MAQRTHAPARYHTVGRRLRFTAIGILAILAVFTFPTAAQAHHGWDGFETSKLMYVSGTVSSEGVWGDPHSHFDLTVDESLPSQTPKLPITQELSGPEDSIRVQSAPSYKGTHRELEIIIAPPWWSSNNGLDRHLQVGERFQAVGYINKTDDGLFRPVAFWYGENNTPVNQVIGNTLPFRAPLPGAESTGNRASPAPPTVQDPVEMSGPAEDAATPDHSGTFTVWLVFGAVVIAAGAAGIILVRRRTRLNERNPDA